MLKYWLYLLGFCLLGVPAIVYWVGGLLAGPYEGERGILGMMGTIYGDALTGHLSALILLFAPMILIGIWIGCSRLRQFLRARAAA